LFYEDLGVNGADEDYGGTLERDRNKVAKVDLGPLESIESCSTKLKDLGEGRKKGVEPHLAGRCSRRKILIGPPWPWRRDEEVSKEGDTWSVL
jgi:hypothetical protein